MRLALLAITVSCLSISSQAFELAPLQDKSVESLEVQLSSKESEYESFITSLSLLSTQVDNETDKLGLLRSQGDDLQTAREQALLNMNEQYEALVDNPEQDIAQAQNAYRQTILNQKQNKDDIKASVSCLPN